MSYQQDLTWITRTRRVLIIIIIIITTTTRIIRPIHQDHTHNTTLPHIKTHQKQHIHHLPHLSTTRPLCWSSTTPHPQWPLSWSNVLPLLPSCATRSSNIPNIPSKYRYIPYPRIQWTICNKRRICCAQHFAMSSLLQCTMTSCSNITSSTHCTQFGTTSARLITITIVISCNFAVLGF